MSKAIYFGAVRGLHAGRAAPRAYRPPRVFELVGRRYAHPADSSLPGQRVEQRELPAGPAAGPPRGAGAVVAAQRLVQPRRSGCGTPARGTVLRRAAGRCASVRAVFRSRVILQVGAGWWPAAGSGRPISRPLPGGSSPARAARPGGRRSRPGWRRSGSSETAVFSPIPLTPGMLSEVSPTRAL